ncbi:unnamed protein product [Withania somnifera]
MNDSQFLFELPTRKEAERCWPVEEPRSWVWIRIYGLPLSLWSQSIFRQIGDACGGWIEMEEETIS